MKFKITEKHREIARLIWEDKITQGEIAKQFHISEDTISLWKRKPEFQALLDELDEEYRRQIKRECLRSAKTSMRTLIKTQEIRKVKIDETKEETIDEFAHGSETARKSAVNVLEMAEVMPKEGEEKEHPPVIIKISRETVNGEGS